LERSRSIALFGFKTAVVIDHLKRDRPPFFDREVRYEFRKSLAIPPNVRVWMAGFESRKRGDIHSSYHESLSPGTSLETYACTYAVERLILQIVGHKNHVFKSIKPMSDFPAVPIWPPRPDIVVWPFPAEIRTVEEFDAFSARWKDLEVEP
jgi:hypothetical protein